MSEPVYRLESVVKSYAERQVLQVEQLEVHRGEILAIVGPSGAGKSTLLRLLNLLEPPTSGRIWFDGTWLDPSSRVPMDLIRRVTTVFQRPVLLNRSVWHNVAYGLRLRGCRDSAGEIDAALEQVGLAGMARSKTRALSGGEAQRVALARALVLRPEVLLLDEPTANLDPYNVRAIEEIVGTLNRESGTTIVLVTHNVFQARRLAHRVGLLLDGRLIEVAKVDAFFDSPSDPRAAAFCSGEMVY